MSKRNRAFTIVEMLTVVVIIGLLVALLVPAVNMARESARQAKCVNNQREIGLAILQYEIAKRQLPGFIGKSGGKNLNWVISLLPFLERKDIWDAYQRNSLVPVRVDRLVCPDDGAAKEMNAPLSYVVNDVQFLNRTTTPPVDKYGAKVDNERSVSQLGSLRQRVMLGERTLGEPVTDVNGPSSADTLYHAGPWTAMTWWALTLNWPKPLPSGTTRTAAMPFELVTQTLCDSTKAAVEKSDSGLQALLNQWPQLSPKVVTANHPGIAILTFLDGHTDKIVTETLTSNFELFASPWAP